MPRRPDMAEFRQRLRYHQARWPEINGHPIGTQPIAPKPGAAPRRPVGSRLPLAYARETGANFITAKTLEAARARTSSVEPHQSFDQQRLWADLLSSEALSFNLFGDLAADLGTADRAVHIWWPDAPGTVGGVRFAHSPGRLDPIYLNSLRAFDVAFVLDIGGGARGVLGVDVRYHEWAKPEIPKPSNMPRYVEVAERSGVFRPGAIDEVMGRSALCEMWLEHLLVLSMLQHESGTWSWGRYVVVHPAGNSDFEEACARYRGTAHRHIDIRLGDTRGAARRRSPHQEDDLGAAPTLPARVRATGARSHSAWPRTAGATPAPVAPPWVGCPQSWIAPKMRHRREPVLTAASCLRRGPVGKLRSRGLSASTPSERSCVG